MSRIKKLFDLTGKVGKQESVEAVAETFKKDGLEAIGIACHVGDSEQQDNLIEQTIAKYGRIDCLINNAGTNPYFGPIDQMPFPAYQKTMDINLNAPMELSRKAYPHMKSHGSGSIIHISSIEGLHATTGFAAYNLSKAALVMLAQNQAAEWGKDNIRVNVICPGLVKTKLSAALWSDEKNLQRFQKNIPLGRMAHPDEMAGLAVFLMSSASSYMTGSVLVNDGGILHAPTQIREAYNVCLFFCCYIALDLSSRVICAARLDHFIDLIYLLYPQLRLNILKDTISRRSL